MSLDHLPSTWLASAAQQWPEETFIHSDIGSLTFSAVRTQVLRLRRWMQGQGFEKGDRIVIVMPNRAEVAVLIFAALEQGIIFTILSHQIQPEGLHRILAQCEPRCVFLDSSTAPLVVALSDAPRLEVGTAGWTAILNDDEAGDVEIAELKPTDIAFLVFTSGSTGTPRGVMLTHGNVAFVSAAIQARLRYTPQDRLGIFLPLAFDYSLYQLFYGCLCGSSLFIGRPEMVGPELPRVLGREEITILPAVPTVFAALIKMQRYRPVPLPRLRMITNTGDHLPRAYVDQIRHLLPDAQVFPMFGLTECKRVSILLPEEYESHPQSVGRPLDGTEVFAVNSEGRRLPAGQRGELVVQGPHLAAGYWRAPEETAKRYRDLDGIRTLFCGDQGSVDEAGYITFYSRDDFVIKHRGTRLNPAEVEDIACTMPQIIAAGCVKDDQRDLLCLFLATAQDTLNQATVLSTLAAKLERGKLPDRVIFVPELPRTANQKLDRKALRSLLTTV